MPRLEDHSEVELKLTLVGDDPDGLLDRVAALDRLGDDELGPVRQHQLRDVYWDTPKRRLRHHGLTLRIREMDGATFFTAKGGTSSKDGLFRRYELELPATLDNWHAMREALASFGASFTGFAAREGSPAEWLAASGLILTQDRTTARRTREVRHGGRPIAELALDHTTFRFRTLVVEYREIEIEQLSDGEVDLYAFRDILSDLFPGRLEASTMGKYSRGLLLERHLTSAGLI